MVFSRKRRDGLFARPHFSYVDAHGHFHKPFVLSQKDPTFYDTFLRTYNLPELIQEPIRVTQADLARALRTPLRVLTPKTDTDEAKGQPVNKPIGDPGSPYPQIK